MAATNPLLGIANFAAAPQPALHIKPACEDDVGPSPASPRHGQVCAELVRVLGNYAHEHDIGHVLNGDAGFSTGSDPEIVGTPDVAFVSFAKLPKGPLTGSHLNVAPEVVFEIHSPDDQAAEMGEKVHQYLAAGVEIVVVVDPETATGLICEAGQTVRFLTPDDLLDVGGVLGSLGVTLRMLCQ